MELRPSESGIFALADPENRVHLSGASSVQDKTGELLAYVLNSRERSCLGRRLKTLYESPTKKWVWVLPSVAPGHFCVWDSPVLGSEPVLTPRVAVTVVRYHKPGSSNTWVLAQFCRLEVLSQGVTGPCLLRVSQRDFSCSPQCPFACSCIFPVSAAVNTWPFVSICLAYEDTDWLELFLNADISYCQSWYHSKERAFLLDTFPLSLHFLLEHPHPLGTVVSRSEGISFLKSGTGKRCTKELSSCAGECRVPCSCTFSLPPAPFCLCVLVGRAVEGVGEACRHNCLPKACWPSSAVH